MKKRLGVGGFFLLITILFSLFILADSPTSNLQVDGDNYNLELMFMDQDSITLKVNGETRSIDTIQTSPYYLTEIGGLDCILKDITYQAFVGGDQEAIVWVGVEINLSFSPEEDLIKNLIIDGVEYIIELEFLDSDSISLEVNGQSRSIDTIQTSPYYPLEVNGLDVILKDITYQAFVGGKQEATFLVGKDIGFDISEPEPVSSCEDNVCTLYEGQSVTDTVGGNSYTISIDFISSSEVKLDVDGTKTSNLNEGSSEVISGVTITINDVIYSSQTNEQNSVIFTLSEVELISSCEEKICTLYEGGEVNPNGHATNIEFMDVGEVKLNIGGEITNKLSEGDDYENADTRFTIKEIIFSSVVTIPSYIEFEYEDIVESSCEDGLCTLYEGGEVNPNGHSTKIEFMDTTGVKLNVDGEVTNKLDEGDTYENADTRFTIKEIMFSSIVTTPSYVEFEYEDIIESFCGGCLLNEKCYDFGHRKSGNYCSDLGEFLQQLDPEESCENNFECRSNLCLDEKCVSGGLIQKIINWLRRLFFGE